MTEKEEKVEKTTEQETQTATPTQEEIDALVAKAKEDGKTEAQKEYQGIQRTVAAKDREIKKLKEQTAQPSGRTRSTEIQLEDMKARQQETGEPNPRIAMLEAELQREMRTDYVERTTREAREKLDRKIVEAGYDPSDKMFRPVNKEFRLAYRLDGEFGYADELLDEILADVKQETKPPEGEKKKTFSEEDVEELKRRWMEEQGLLSTSDGGPSGSPDEWETLRLKYGEGTATRAEKERYLVMRRERGR